MGDNPKVFRWLLDVRNLWPIPDHKVHQPSSSTAQWADGADAKKALSFLSSDEKAKVLRFYFPKDAKLSLASNLLKRCAITYACHIAWSDASISEDHNRKPCYKPRSPNALKMEFNVSHHGTLVALVGCNGETQKLGIDIVQLNWDKDYPAVLKEGFPAWVKVYELVFSDREVADIIAYSLPGLSDPCEQIKAKLRHFYAHWCLKEAYVKMTGEALLARWLKDLEFRNVRVPEESDHGGWGQTCSVHEVWLKGAKLTGIKMELQAFGEEYMLATAVSEPNALLLPFKELDLKHDVLPE
ncbi:hypothetical protein MMC31_003089 [Peltigera leucophlebia]|nr:hypothetical protein [Peltigera leucophlebia]